MTETFYIVIISILLLINLLSFVLGYTLGKITNNSQQNFWNLSKFNNKEINSNNLEKISIDETKVVHKIDTNNLEKKYNNLGQTVVSSENISDSINKLKKLKN